MERRVSTPIPDNWRTVMRRAITEHQQLRFFLREALQEAQRLHLGKDSLETFREAVLVERSKLFKATADRIQAERGINPSGNAEKDYEITMEEMQMHYDRQFRLYGAYNAIEHGLNAMQNKIMPMQRKIRLAKQKSHELAA